MAQQNALAAAAAAAVQQQQQQQQQHQQSAAAAASFYAKSFSNTGVRTAQSRLYWGAGCALLRVELSALRFCGELDIVSPYFTAV